MITKNAVSVTRDLRAFFFVHYISIFNIFFIQKFVSSVFCILFIDVFLLELQLLLSRQPCQMSLAEIMKVGTIFLRRLFENVYYILYIFYVLKMQAIYHQFYYHFQCTQMVKNYSIATIGRTVPQSCIALMAFEYYQSFGLFSDILIWFQLSHHLLILFSF